MRWEQAKCMEKKIKRKRNRTGEERWEEGVKREWEGEGTWRRERGEGDGKRSRQLGWERGLNWKGGIRE